MADSESIKNLGTGFHIRRRGSTYHTDFFVAAMAITDQVEADGYFERLVQHTMSFGTRREEAERIERCNLGYWAGYYSHETRERVERLFRCAHPFFGSIAEKGPMAPEEIFEMGLRMGRASRSAPQRG